ncbi:MAG: 16S rRNA (cytidine(1402)-2'-O)-methyltransferase [Candidatus Stygibacter frigidus]|nr:16S rRNA (cytidine(1402)-2'-O)-methyltransferase [Candidatus Stygibacter frigidus]
MKTNGKLFLVPTPIGNLKDITLRALEVLEMVDLIGAEDTRTSGYLLKHYNISTPMTSYHKFNEKKRSSEFINRLKSGENIAVISDAGSPGISDPAAEIISQAIAAGIMVDALPGATALIPALVASGLPNERFYFIGFLPDKNKVRNNLLQSLKTCPATMIFYVSPHDIMSFASDIFKVFGDREITLARELTKLHEEYIRTTLQDLIDGVDIKLKGEFVAVVAGIKEVTLTDEQILEEINILISTGLSNREIIETISIKEKVAANRVKKLLY